MYNTNASSCRFSSRVSSSHSSKYGSSSIEATHFTTIIIISKVCLAYRSLLRAGRALGSWGQRDPFLHLSCVASSRFVHHLYPSRPAVFHTHFSPPFFILSIINISLYLFLTRILVHSLFVIISSFVCFLISLFFVTYFSLFFHFPCFLFPYFHFPVFLLLLSLSTFSKIS